MAKPSVSVQQSVVVPPIDLSAVLIRTMQKRGLVNFRSLPAVKLRENARRFACDLPVEDTVNALVSLYKHLRVYSMVMRDANGYKIYLRISPSSRIEVPFAGDPTRPAQRVVFWH